MNHAVSMDHNMVHVIIFVDAEGSHILYYTVDISWPSFIMTVGDDFLMNRPSWNIINSSDTEFIFEWAVNGIIYFDKPFYITEASLQRF